MNQPPFYPPPAPNQPPQNPQQAQVAATREQVQKVPGLNSPLSAGVGWAALLSGAIALGGVLCERAKIAGNRDDRDIGTALDEIWDTRRITTPSDTDELTPEKRERFIKTATCIQEKMGFLPTTEPPKGVSRDTWEKNNKTRGKSVLVKLDSKTTVRFEYHENLHGYVAETRWNDLVNTLWQLARNDNWRNQLGWLVDGYKAKYPKKNLNKWSEAKESWTEYIQEVYIGQPLETPHWEDGSPMKSFEGLTPEDHKELKEAIAKNKMEVVKRIRSKGRDCLLVRPLAQRVTAANIAMVKDGKGEIYPTTCHRDTQSQTILLTILAPAEVGPKGEQECRLIVKAKADVQNPGMSHHGLGLAMDVSNWTQAYPYLSVLSGMQCDIFNKAGRFSAVTGIGKGSDRGHCSFGEVGPTPTMALQKKTTEGSLVADDAPDFIKKVLENRGLLNQ